MATVAALPGSARQSSCLAGSNEAEAAWQQTSVQPADGKQYVAASSVLPVAPSPSDFLQGSSPMMWRPHPRWELSSIPCAPSLPLNSGEGIEFATSLFKGVAHMWVAGLPDSPGKERMQGHQTLFTVRGRFLQEGLSHADIITGQEFDRPFQNVPGKWIINSALAMGQQLMPSSDFGDLDTPYMLTPLICCGSLSLEEAEEDVNLADMDPPQIAEDCRVLGAQFQTSSGSPCKESVRKKAYGDRKKRSSTCFRTDLVYSFSFYQRYLDMTTLKFELGYGLSFDLASILNGQPFRMLCKQKSTGDYLWNFELWHAAMADAARKRAASS